MRHQHPRQTTCGEDHREPLAELCGDACAGCLLARPSPHDRPRDPATVERKRGHQVEHQDQYVDREQPAKRQQHRSDVNRGRQLDRMPQPVRADDREIDHQAHEHARERHHRTGDRDPELFARRVRVAAHLCQPAEQEQVDPLHVDPLAAGDERVAELVHDQRPVEQQHGDHGRRVRDGVRALQRVPERPRDKEDDQEQQQEPASIHADPDAERVEQLDRAGPGHHVCAMVAQRMSTSLERLRARHGRADAICARGR